MTSKDLDNVGHSSLLLGSGKKSKKVSQDEGASDQKRRCTLCPKNCVIRPGCILNYLELIPDAGGRD